MSQVVALSQYPTPVWVAEQIVARHFSDLGANDVMIEPSCGEGSFLGAVPAHVEAIGVDIDPVKAAEAASNTGRRVIVGDFRTVVLDVQPTVIAGNPPFNMKLVDAFLDRAHRMLPDGGRVGFLLPTYAFQTAARLARYSDDWSLLQEMVPRNIYQGLKLPLCFALFSKDRRRAMVGFALYREAADVLAMPAPYRAALSAGGGSVWLRVVELALQRLGGEADLPALYAEIAAHRPTRTEFWKEQIRKVLRAHGERFIPVSQGRYSLHRMAA